MDWSNGYENSRGWRFLSDGRRSMPLRLSWQRTSLSSPLPSSGLASQKPNTTATMLKTTTQGSPSDESQPRKIPAQRHMRQYMHLLRKHLRFDLLAARLQRRSTSSAQRAAVVAVLQSLLTLGGLLIRAASSMRTMQAVRHSPCLKDCSKVNDRWLVGQSFTWNTNNPARPFQRPVTLTDRSNEYQMNQLYSGREKATCDNEGCGWDLGCSHRPAVRYRLPLHHGGSSLETAFPVPGSRELRRPPVLRLGLPQFYGEVAYNNLKTKLVTSCRLSVTKLFSNWQLLPHSALHVPIRRTVYPHRCFRELPARRELDLG